MERGKPLYTNILVTAMPYLTMAAGPKGNIDNAQVTSLHFLFENNIKTFCFYGPLTEGSIAGLKAEDLLAHSCH